MDQLVPIGTPQNVTAQSGNRHAATPDLLRSGCFAPTDGGFGSGADRALDCNVQ
jgi:hypothetical protein